VIGVRSFGSSPELVARHTAAWIRGLQSAGVAACVKHFPGHGDTSVDSHLALPLLAGSAEELAEARRAIRVTMAPGGTALPLVTAPHVVEFHPEMNQAIDRITPWGIGVPLAKLLPDTTTARLTPSEATDDARLTEVALTPAAGRPLVLVVRDAHRHKWMSAALDRITAARPDAGVVEMGLPGDTSHGVFHLATHGATKVSGQAAAEVLAGHQI
jgi:beta-N-acetylhexosaminidase